MQNVLFQLEVPPPSPTYGHQHHSHDNGSMPFTSISQNMVSDQKLDRRQV